MNTKLKKFAISIVTISLLSGAAGAQSASTGTTAGTATGTSLGTSTGTGANLGVNTGTGTTLGTNLDLRGQTLSATDLNTRFLSGFDTLDMQNLPAATQADLLDINSVLNQDQTRQLLNSLQGNTAALERADALTNQFRQSGILPQDQRIIGLTDGRFIRIPNTLWDQTIGNMGSSL